MVTLQYTHPLHTPIRHSNKMKHINATNVSTAPNENVNACYLTARITIANQRPTCRPSNAESIFILH